MDCHVVRDHNEVAMEFGCGPFDSATAASWAQAILTGAAAIVAWRLYVKGRSDAHADRVAQRTVLECSLIWLFRRHDDVSVPSLEATHRWNSERAHRSRIMRERIPKENAAHFQKAQVPPR